MSDEDVHTSRFRRGRCPVCLSVGIVKKIMMSMTDFVGVCILLKAICITKQYSLAVCKQTRIFT